MNKKTLRKRLVRKSKLVSYIGIYFVGIASIVLLIGLLPLVRLLPESSFCANSISCIQDLSGTYDSSATTGEFMGKTVTSPPEIADTFINPHVLGEDTGPKRIDVDLTNQKLYAFEGEHLVYSFPISSGKWNPTPTGTFKIWIKLRYTRMKGGNRALGDYYNLPNVPFTMYLYNNEYAKSEGYGIHGAYWHNNFGHPMSHGCVNLSVADSQTLYNWADPTTNGFTTKATNDNPGTTVVIYGDTPTS